METATPAEAKRAAIGGRDAKPKAAKKVLSKEKKGAGTRKRGMQRPPPWRPPSRRSRCI
jgi:hypothetical protein